MTDIIVSHAEQSRVRPGDRRDSNQPERNYGCQFGPGAGVAAGRGLKFFDRGASLAEAGEELITPHKLNVPATLNLSLLSTNAIENVMRNYRGQTARVSRRHLETNQISRWTASALLHVELGFHRIKGFADLPKLLAALAHP